MNAQFPAGCVNSRTDEKIATPTHVLQKLGKLVGDDYTIHALV